MKGGRVASHHDAHAVVEDIASITLKRLRQGIADDQAKCGFTCLLLNPASLRSNEKTGMSRSSPGARLKH